MKKIYWLLIIVFVTAVSCEEPEMKKSVRYQVTDSESGFTVTFTDENGDVQPAEDITTNSAEDIWTHRFMAEPGTVVYLDVEDTTPESFVKVQIYIDGKVYKQSVRSDDATKPVVVSGVVPFD